MSRRPTRRLPIGADVQPDHSTHFRVWAPKPREIAVVIEPGCSAEREIPLDEEGGGYRSVRVPNVAHGDRYGYRVDGDLLPDPASRAQPDGPFGPSQIVDPTCFRWTDAAWRGIRLEGQVISEIHIGTFTREGTWRSAMERLPDLVRTGITVIEVMPVAEFPGGFGWGYDGVFPYAPARLYGTPDDFRAFVNGAHELGLGVILDVVYNHLGPDGCVFRRYAEDYFSKHYENEWGEALNFDGPGSVPVREYFGANAAYWIAEYHLDGLRLDATQSIHDASDDHIITVISRNARAAAGGRDIIIVSENEPQDVRMVRPIERAGHGMDGVWNDDFHHSAVVALTGRNEAYYSDHRGTPQELISAGKRGYLFQGQRYAWQRRPRGTRTDGVPPAAFINFIENHDQLANSGDGSRLRTKTSPGRYRAMTTLVLLLPGTPMLFQGQEFGASSPFLYFADHRSEIASAVRKGRAGFVSQFPSLATPEMQAQLPPPDDPATFERCKLQWDEYRHHSVDRRLHEDLIAMRRLDAAFREQRPDALDGAVLDAEAFVLRFAAPDPADERLLLVNFGRELVAASFAEPLTAPPDGHSWTLRWSSEHPDYGGTGACRVVDASGWRIPGHSAVVLRPWEDADEGDGRRRD